MRALTGLVLCNIVINEGEVGKGEDLFKHLTVEKTNGLRVVRLQFSRQRDFSEYDELNEELRCLAHEKGANAVLINLEAVEFVSSRMLGILIGLAKDLAQSGKRLAACRLRPEPSRVFAMCRVDAIIPTFGSENEARAALPD